MKTILKITSTALLTSRMYKEGKKEYLIALYELGDLRKATEYLFRFEIISCEEFTELNKFINKKEEEIRNV